MPTNNTKRTTSGRKPQAGAKSTTGKKQTNSKKNGTRGAVSNVPEEELIPGLSNELILMITLVLSLLLLLSNFSLSGRVGEAINQVTFGLFGFLAYIIPFFLFFGVAFYLANRTGSKRYVVKLAASIALFVILAAVFQIAGGETAEESVFLYYKQSAQNKNGGGLLGGLICAMFLPLFGKVGSYVVLAAISVFCIMLLTGKALFAFLADAGGKEVERQKEIYKDYVQERRVIREEREEKEEWEWKERNKSRAQSFLLPNGQEEIPLKKEGLKRNFFGGFSSTSPARQEEMSEELSEIISIPEHPEQTSESVPSANSAWQLQEEPTPAKIHSIKEQPESSDFTKEYSFSKKTDSTVGSIYEEELRKKFGRREKEPVTDEELSSDLDTLSSKEKEASEEPLPDVQVKEEFEEEPLPDVQIKEEFKEEPLPDVQVKEEFKEEPLPDVQVKEEFEEEPLPDVQIKEEFEEEPLPDVQIKEELKKEPLQEEWMGESLSSVQPEKKDWLKEPLEIEEVVVPAKPTALELESSYEPFEPSFSEQALLDKRQPESPIAKEAFAHAAYTVLTKKSETELTSGKYSVLEGLPERNLEKMQEITAGNPSVQEIAEVAQEAVAAQEEKLPEYRFPSTELLSKPVIKDMGNAEEELQQTAQKLQNTLKSFGVRVTVSNASRGPAVTRYELQPEQGVKVSKITALADDIKLNLAAADIRIEAPIPGKAAVGIEVPNKENTAVYLRELMESLEFINHSSNLAFAVGKDIGGQNIVSDIAKMPHMLIAGSTGSGKSVCINTIIMSILYKAHPDDVKLIMVDPKMVELSVYNGIPHLLIPVVTDSKKASAALNWAVTEMLERYDKFAALGVRDLKGYNERVEEAANEGITEERFKKLPQIVIIVDELADLMMVAPGEVEDAICRLAQMARAAGMHLILATQRPSVNVITGLIKANVPSRIAFAVSSGVDSRTILDSVGAEKLLGKGDMLFFPSGYPKPVRIQGAYVSDKEVSSVVEFLKSQNAGRLRYNEEVTKRIATTMAGETGMSGSSENGWDEYFAEAGRFIIEKDKASVSMLQRMYKIGFNRAARIMDQLAEAGVVGPEDGTKPRKILMTAEEFEQKISNLSE